MRMKINTTIIYFSKKVRVKINPIHNIFEWMFVYYKCYISFRLNWCFWRTWYYKTSASKKCDICHYWYFLNKGFKFQPNVCNKCHVLLTISVNLSDIAILSINSADYCCIISGISKNETINLMQNVDLTGKIRTL